MDFIKGKYKTSIFSSESGYVVGLFRVKESCENLEDIVNKTITFTGYFPELNTEDTYMLYGKYVFHERYGFQFQVTSYERIEPVGYDAVVEFLTSSFVKGCGEKTAKKIVDALGNDAIKLIKEDKNNLINIGVAPTTAEKIYQSIMNYYDLDETIVYLTGLGFSVKEITRILTLFGKSSRKIVETNLYGLIDFIDFEKLDKIFFNIYEETNDMRILACIIETMKRKTFENGDIYLTKEEIYDYLLNVFKINLYDSFDDYIDRLKYNSEVVVVDNKYYIYSYNKDENYIADTLTKMNNRLEMKAFNFESDLESVEKEFNIKYNQEQKNAIYAGLTNSLTIITGGPGTGKTTIINGLLRMYQYNNGLTDLQMNNAVALLAPTGRASKRMSETTHYGSSTIHRYLKYNMESREYGINEYNPNPHRLIIVDEVSMIDNELMAALLRGIEHSAQLVLVGDEFQLPSVGPGNILKDLIETDMFNHIRLENIYRQSEKSFIPILASEIKNKNIESDISLKCDDYNFLECPKSNIKTMLREIINKCIDKELTEKDIQILAPMYKGENGIDNMNIMLQELFNPTSDRKEEVHIGPVIYRENDKILNLVNNVDENIFNGDIGYIKKINPTNSKEFMVIDYYGNFVTMKREDVSTIKHAYAMTIHKSQGSEFNHVVIPLTNEFYRMLYNKLLYTGVSRAKKSLIIIGNEDAFMYAVNNSYSVIRKTTLKDKILNNYNN